MKIEHGNGFERNLIIKDASSKFRHVDPVKFKEFVVSFVLNYKERVLAYPIQTDREMKLLF